MNFSLYTFLLITIISCSDLFCTNDKNLIKQCFKAIAENKIKTVVQLIKNGKVDVNAVIDLNKDYLTESDFYTFERESTCSLLEWTRYHGRSALYAFLSQQKDINFKVACFLPLEAGSLIPINKDHSYNKNNENFYPLNQEAWPIIKPTQITKENIKLLKITRRWEN